MPQEDYDLQSEIYWYLKSTNMFNWSVAECMLASFKKECFSIQDVPPLANRCTAIEALKLLGEM